MSSAEVNYPIHDKELLAIIKCLREWDGELRSVSELTIVTNHKNLEFFLSKQRLNERQVRWSEELSKYRFHLRYRSGTLAALPDGLSRRPQDAPTSDDERMALREGRVLQPISIANIEGSREPRIEEAEMTETAIQDPPLLSAEESPLPQPPIKTPDLDDSELEELWATALVDIVNALKRSQRQPPANAPHVSFAECCLSSEDDVLLYRGALWVPNSEPLRTNIISRNHDPLIVGHPGRETTFELIRRAFF